MKIIKTKRDLVMLHRVGALPAALLDQVEDYFNQLSVELEDEFEIDFCLGAQGYIVVLKAGDNVRDLGNFRLSREDGSKEPNFSPSLVIRFPPINLYRAVHLLHQHQPHQLVRQGHAPEAELRLGAL